MKKNIAANGNQADLEIIARLVAKLLQDEHFIGRAPTGSSRSSERATSVDRSGDSPAPRTESIARQGAGPPEPAHGFDRADRAILQTKRALVLQKHRRVAVRGAAWPALGLGRHIPAESADRADAPAHCGVERPHLFPGILETAADTDTAVRNFA